MLESRFESIQNHIHNDLQRMRKIAIILAYILRCFNCGFRNTTEHMGFIENLPS